MYLHFYTSVCSVQLSVSYKEKHYRNESLLVDFFCHFSLLDDQQTTNPPPTNKQQKQNHSPQNRAKTVIKNLLKNKNETKRNKTRHPRGQKAISLDRCLKQGNEVTELTYFPALGNIHYSA